MKEHAFNSIAVFCYIVDSDNRVLLIERATPPTQGEYTIPGGKKELNEDLVSACKREMLEETGLTVENMELRAVVTACSEGWGFDVICLYYLSRDFSGELRESVEGHLKWCDLEESMTMDRISAPYVRITPHVLKEGVSNGYFRYKNGQPETWFVND